MNDRKIPVSISISKKLLSQIEQDVEGKDRSEKIIKCAEIGYKLLTQNGE